MGEQVGAGIKNEKVLDKTVKIMIKYLLAELFTSD